MSVKLSIHDMVNLYRVETRVFINWMKRMGKDCGCPAAILQPSSGGKYPLDSAYFTQVACEIAKKSKEIPQSVITSLQIAIDYRYQVHRHHIAQRFSRQTESDKSHEWFVSELEKVRSILNDLPVTCDQRIESSGHKRGSNKHCKR